VQPGESLRDHASFWDEGCRAVMVTESALFCSPHYHLPSEAMETLDLDFTAERVARLTGFFAPIPPNSIRCDATLAKYLFQK
jgi:hypothetical protein